MAEQQLKVNISALSVGLLQDLVQPLSYEIALKAFYEAKGSQVPCARCSSLKCKHYVQQASKDIYGRDSTPETSYFECANCARKISGARYAAHLERCLSGRNTRNKAAASIAQSTASPASVSPSSPYVTEDESPPKPRKRRAERDAITVEAGRPKSEVQKFLDRDEERARPAGGSRSASPAGRAHARKKPRG
ncbi:uncharacterized protein V1510DRAFT_422579 [Dipodascopsis tothii]|uniref:uncharacterized protein n=1 Tax=Dipodascopsis tothii TaxID=44089 RepID=UPI0034CD4760